MRDFVSGVSTNVVKLDFADPASLADAWANCREKFLEFCSRVYLPRKVATEIWSSIPFSEQGTNESLVEAYFLAGELAFRYSEPRPHLRAVPQKQDPSAN